MSPQHSNREALVEGALRCLEESPTARITARQIAAASKANLGSIGYHFGSTEALLAHAMAEGFRRWLRELSAEMGDADELSPMERIQRASRIATRSVTDHQGLIRAFLAAVASAPHDEDLRATLAESYAESRKDLAALLGLGSDAVAAHAASLMLATFDGLLIQTVLEPKSQISLEELTAGLARLAMLTEP